MKNKLFILSIISLLLFSGCSSTYDISENEFDESILEGEPVEVKTENYILKTETLEKVNEFECSGSIRCAKDQIGVEDGKIELAFTLIAPYKSKVNEAELILESGKTCSLKEVKNIDTQLTSTQMDLYFLNGQTGKISFSCEGLTQADRDGLSGDLTVYVVNTKTEIKVPSKGSFKLGVEELVIKNELNKELFPETIGDYKLSELELTEEREASFHVSIIYKNEFEKLRGGLMILEESSRNEILREIAGEFKPLNISEGMVLQGTRDNIYVWFTENEFELVVLESSSNPYSEVFKWFIKEFPSDSSRISEIDFLESSAQSNLNYEVEERSSYGSTPSVERLSSSGSVYIKNPGQNAIKFTGKISSDSKELLCELGQSTLGASTVGQFDAACANDLVAGNMYEIILITESGVISTKMIAR